MVKGMPPLEWLSPSVATTAGCRNLPDWQPTVSNSLIVAPVGADSIERQLFPKADVQIAELRSKQPSANGQKRFLLTARTHFNHPLEPAETPKPCLMPTSVFFDRVLYSRQMKNCNSCGKCCEKWGNDGLSASAEEIDWWETYRPDIARYVQDEKIWIDPATGDYFARCPWLQKSTDGKKFTCDIYDVRPEDCRHYPVDIAEMVRDDCEMLEQRDLVDLRGAQRKLDEIMIDSRPPAGRRP
jgi:Fe-S-cluster containining protein